MARSVKTNYLYNLLYQITAILLPLITMPYVSRVLGPQGVGTNSLTNANTQYFMLLGTLGITMYATKKIATVRENKRKLRQTFWEIFSIQFIGCMISYVIFVLVLGLNDSIIRLIDNFDFTGFVPKIVIYLENENTLPESMQMILGYFHTIGIDIIIFNPSGLFNINNIINESIVNEFRLDIMKYDSKYKELINMKQGIFSRFLRNR